MKRILFLLLALPVVACSGKADDEVVSPPVFEIVVRGMAFEAPAEVPAGWVTFRFRNESAMTHFAVVERMPGGKGIVDQQNEVAPVFQEGMDLLIAEDGEAALAAFGKLPAWFGEIVFLGGPGLLSAGRVSDATVRLEPGTYLLECYLKTNGIFHSYNPDPEVYGMVHEFTVTAEPSGAAEPEADLAITISSGEGITAPASVTPGDHVVKITYTDQMVHENFVGHDVHLARIDGDTDLGGLETWMSWTVPDGLATPAPVEFLGGLNEMPAGGVGYLRVSLEPGTYAWISEVPGASAKGMLRTFAVEPE
jgi:hypothetical protein